MNSILAWVVVAIVIIGGGWWYFSQPSAPALTGPVKIGVILPLTGDAAAYGEPARNILQIAAERINTDGGVGGNPIEFIFEDGKCSGASAASAMQKLANVDKVQVVIGGFCSSESIAAEPIATAAKVVLFSPGSSNPGLTNVSSYFARNYPSDSAQGEVLAKVAVEKKYKKVAVLQEQTDYSVGLYTSFNTAFVATGGTSIKEEFVSTQTDLRTTLGKLRSANTDALFIIVQTPASAERIFKQLRDLGWKPKLFVSDVIPGFSDLVKANKDLLEGAIAAEFTANADNAKLKELVTAYTTKHGAEPPLLAYAQTEYDSVFIIADAVRAVGYDGTKIANWLRTNVKNWQGAAGSVTIGSNGDPITGHRPEVITNGVIGPYVN